MQAGVVTFPGSNCDRDLRVAFEKVTGKPALALWHDDSELPPLDIIAIPGGFSYGDYLRSGAIAARSAIIPSIIERARRGTPVLGICNGFQILCECGLLPGALVRNNNTRFICRFTNLEIQTGESPFTRGMPKSTRISLPVAHHDGNFTIDQEGFKKLQDQDQIALTYCENLNGSVGRIAGILSEQRHILGLMPHPERAIEDELGGRDGLLLFQSLAGQLAGV